MEVCVKKESRKAYLARTGQVLLTLAFDMRHVPDEFRVRKGITSCGVFRITRPVTPEEAEKIYQALPRNNVKHDTRESIEP